MFSLGRRASTSLAVLLAVVLGVSLAPTVEARLNGTAGGGRPSDARSRPLALPPAVDTAGPHAFLETVDGVPARYDPCAPIHVVVNSRTAIDGADQMLAQALDSISGATGLTFVDDGATDEAPSRSRGTSPGARGPVLIAWSDAREDPELKGDVAGIGGSIRAAGSRWYDTGDVTLDGPQLADILDERSGFASARSVVLHELGHLVGLDHVDAAGELMQPEGSPDVVDWGPGDREGLAALGGGECRDY